MAGKPKNFQVISNVLSNYDFVDIASGTGYINFYLGQTSTAKLISNFAFYGYPTSTSGTAAASQTDTLGIDDDYDVLLNRPMDLAGTGIANVTLNSNSLQLSTRAKVIVRKWDGATETDIVTSDFGASATNGTVTSAISFTIPLTHFKKGEYLRLTVRIYYTSTGAGAGTTYTYYYDPKTLPNQLLFYCPVRLNL